jgi:hypothetical protein
MEHVQTENPIQVEIALNSLTAFYSHSGCELNQSHQNELIIIFDLAFNSLSDDMNVKGAAIRAYSKILALYDYLNHKKELCRFSSMYVQSLINYLKHNGL